jgi:hypothetical protein
MKIFLLQNYNGSASICFEQGKKKNQETVVCPKGAKRWELPLFSFITDNCSLQARGALE